MWRRSSRVAEQNVGMRAFIGVTDDGWYRFLATRPELTEVNFWRPSGRNSFRALDPGEPFFFKTHHPHNKILGGGFFPMHRRTVRRKITGSHEEDHS
jgi:hypothetical protein